MSRLTLLFFSLFLLPKNSIGQTLDPQNFNQKYAEHLVKIKIDSIRVSVGLEGLVNDSILYVAAGHHTAYMTEKNILSHFEQENSPTYSPQLRAEFYGAKNYLVGENVLKTFVNKNIQGKDGKKIYTGTYQGLANSIVNSWKNSPGHYKNIITKDYQITGLSLHIDSSGMVYACQKFAKVLYTYEFSESKSLFAYSAYQKPTPVNSFAGISNKLIKGYTYDWGLTHDKPESCASCDTLVLLKPHITLRIENDNFVLRIENSAYVKNLIHDKFDGFAVEIVRFDDYMCGNPAYYTKPSRRNGQLMTNGTVLMPVYRKALLRGFKKRKRNNGIKFVNYLFNAEHVRFVNRFSHYKMDKYSSEYFEIRLGRVPKNISGPWAHNLLYIQDKQICHVDYFTNYCGTLFKDSAVAEFIPPDTLSDYVFELEKKNLEFIIPFKQGEFSFTQSDIAPFLDSLTALTYRVDSIYIHAYSSVEGDSITNHQLQKKRAESIATVLTENKYGNVPVKIETSTAWDEFRKEVNKNSSWAYLSKLDNDEISALLQGSLRDELEPLLSKQRKALVRLYATIPFEDVNLEYYVTRDFKKIDLEMSAIMKKHMDPSGWLNQYENLYRYVYKCVQEGRLSAEYLAAIHMPVGYETLPALVEDFFLFGHTYPKDFAKNRLWVQNQDANLNLMMGSYFEEASACMIYNGSFFKYKALLQNPPTDKEPINILFNYLKPLSRSYQSDSLMRRNIENLTFNLNFLLLTEILAKNPGDYAHDARSCIQQIFLFYESRGQMDKTKALQLARASVFFSNNQDALIYLEPFMEDEEVLAYAIPLMFDHPSRAYTEEYYNMVIEKAGTLPTETWCNLFLSHCQIPFQAFDHEQLRNLFCSKCLSENGFMQKLLQ